MAPALECPQYPGNSPGHSFMYIAAKTIGKRKVRVTHKVAAMRKTTLAPPI